MAKATKTATKAPTVASLQKRIKELEAQLAAVSGDRVEHVRTDNGLTRHKMALGVNEHNYTPSAVDAIRLYTWAEKTKGVEKKSIIASLISQQFTPATVRTRVTRIFNGSDESCYSEEIRARLGLDEVEEEVDEEGEGDE